MTAELFRKKRVISMMISMHAILYHRYRRRALISKISFLIAAIILNVLTFADYKYFTFFHLNLEFSKNLLGVISFLIFLTSVIFLLVEWNERVEAHKMAKQQLTKLLNEVRKILAIENEETLANKIESFDELYNQTFETIQSIPEKKFNCLKTKHYRKVELSKFIDDHKGRSFFTIRLMFAKKNIFNNE